ncbi:MAG: PilZ domain-containing protein [Gammaproteobacteria bacterium]|nr:PilZ domain-containing protein [Gammaproteobacteria bacterium]
MNSEKRNHERKNLDYDQIPGKFQVDLSGELFEFNQVNDVSISGMGLLFPRSVSAGQTIQISYQSEEFNTALEAEVIWEEKLSDGVFRLGVEFSTKNMDDNIMLFMTLREYIDDFGEAF